MSVWTVAALSADAWDDALFFKRFGVNTVDHGVAAWNVDDGPVHGNTSQLFQAVATAVVAVARHHYISNIKLLLGASLIGAFILLTLALSRLLPCEETGEPGTRLGAASVLIVGLSAPIACLLIASCMETLLAVAIIALFLLMLAHVQAGRLKTRVAEVAAFVGAHALVYLIRPDMSLIAFAVSAIVLYDPARAPRFQVRLLGLCGVALCGILLLLVGLHLYYGTALPLSFYLKNSYLSSYSEHYQNLDISGKRRHLATWALMFAPFLYISLFRIRRWTIALLVSAALFITYHYNSTIEIMGYHARFYLPAAVPVLLAAALAWPDFARRPAWHRTIPLVIAYPLLVYYGYEQGWIEVWERGFYLAWVHPDHYKAYVVAVVVLGIAPLLGRLRPYIAGMLLPALVFAGAVHSNSFPRWTFPDDNTVSHNMARRMNAMVGISDVKACLPEPLHLYHSELGVPGITFLDSKITDLSGLMNPPLVFEAPAFDDYCLSDPPDVLFLPHRTHKLLNREIKRSRCIGKFIHPRGIRRSVSTLYIRRDLLPEFNECRRARRRQ